MGTDVQQLLQEGISAAREGRREEAKRLLLDVIALDERNLEGWLWLGGIAKDAREALSYLEKALAIKPDSVRAQKGIEWARAKLAEQNRYVSSATGGQVVEGFARTAGEALESASFGYNRTSLPAAQDFAPSGMADNIAATEIGQVSSESRVNEVEQECESSGIGTSTESSEDVFKGILKEETPWTVSSSGDVSRFKFGGDNTEIEEEPEPVDWQDVIARLKSLDVNSPSSGEGTSGTYAFGGLETPEEDNETANLPVDVLLSQGKAALEGGRTEQAVIKFKTAVQKDPKNAEAHEQLGVAYYQSGQIDEALESFENLARLSPTNVEAYANLGFLYSEKGRFGEATEALKTALNLDSSLIEARVNLADVLKKQDKLNEAIEEWKSCIMQKPDMVEAHVALGDIYAKQGKVPEAVWEYRLILDRKPGETQIRAKLGMLLLEMDRPVDAAKELEMALKADDSIAEAHFGMGLIYLADGMNEEARAELEKTLALRPDYPEAKEKFEEALRKEKNSGSAAQDDSSQSEKKGFWGRFKR